MCGIAGFWQNKPASRDLVKKMADEIRSRGPDDSGAWCSPTEGFALAHRRLSVIDLSQAGHQPMLSQCENFVLAFNGEIYNHLEIRAELELLRPGIVWRGLSDTETILFAFSIWGVEPTLKRLNGMFAFALWNEAEKSLVLGRDRMGEKPLYYGNVGGAFLFGSELKALKAYPSWDGRVDRDVLALFLAHSCVPSPYCIYKGLFKLPPAHFVVVRDEGRRVDEPRCYWSVKEIAQDGVSASMLDSRSPETVCESFEQLLNSSIKTRMQADVPLGAFLSGGYDSTAVAALMQRESSDRIKTFSIGFRDSAFNEALHAGAVARHLNTEHSELYVTSSQALDVIPRLPYIYDEPFSDSSQIPTFLVCQLARKEVTVALSGDGGDELLAGYNRHVYGPYIWGGIKNLPAPARRLCARYFAQIAKRDVQSFYRYLPAKLRFPGIDSKLAKLADALESASGVEFYRSLSTQWKSPEACVIGSSGVGTILSRTDDYPNLGGLQDLMQYLDQVTYLPDDILTKVDRASMAVGLEARVPFLDHRLIEFAWALPSVYKVKGRKGKWLLKELVHRYVPKELMERPKQGFGIPLAEWLRGPLYEWAENLLSEKRLLAEGFFDATLVRSKWEGFVEGKAGVEQQLWSILMFQAWLDENPQAR